MNHDYRIAREKMVKNQLIPRSITDQEWSQLMDKIVDIVNTQRPWNIFNTIATVWYMPALIQAQ